MTTHPTKPRGPDWWSRAKQHPVLLMALAWGACTSALFLLRPGHTFTLFGGVIDTWLYSSLQWDFRGQVAEFTPTYYAARLTALLPGMFFHHFLPADCANLATKILISGLLALSMGMLGRAIGGLRAGLLAVILATVAPQVIVFLESDCMDTYVVLYGSATLVCLHCAGSSRSWPAWFALAGLSYAAMGVANLTAYATPGGGLAAFCLYQLQWFRWNWRRQAVSVIAFAAGAATLYLLLGLINRWLVGYFDFWWPQVSALRALNSSQNTWMPKGAMWLTEATWLIVPAFAALWGSYKSWIDTPADENLRRGLRALTVGLLVSIGVMFAYGLHNQFGMFWLHYYASFHLCLALPVLAVSCASSFRDPIPSLRWTGVVWLLLTGVVLIYDQPGAVTGFIARHLPFDIAQARIHHLLAALLLGGTLVCLPTLQRWPEKLRRLLGPELLLAGIMICSVPIYLFAPNPAQRAHYVAAHDAFRVINATFAPRSYAIWEDPRHPNTRGVSSSKFWASSLFTELPFPQFAQQDVERLAGKVIIVPGLYGEGRKVIAEANQALAAAKLATGAERVIHVPGEHGTGFDLACFELRRARLDPENPPPGAPPAVLRFNFSTYSTPSYLNDVSTTVPPAAGGPVIDPTPQRPAFLHTNPRDHAATDFITFPTLTPPRDRQLAIVALLAEDGHVICTIQDENFTHLAHLVLTKPGRSVHMATLPAGSNRLRVVFESPRVPRTPLPTHLLVYEISDP